MNNYQRAYDVRRDGPPAQGTGLANPSDAILSGPRHLGLCLALSTFGGSRVGRLGLILTGVSLPIFAYFVRGSLTHAVDAMPLPGLLIPFFAVAIGLVMCVSSAMRAIRTNALLRHGSLTRPVEVNVEQKARELHGGSRYGRSRNRRVLVWEVRISFRDSAGQLRKGLRTLPDAATVNSTSLEWLLFDRNNPANFELIDLLPGGAKFTAQGELRAAMLPTIVGLAPLAAMIALITALSALLWNR